MKTVLNSPDLTTLPSQESLIQLDKGQNIQDLICVPRVNQSIYYCNHKDCQKKQSFPFTILGYWHSKIIVFVLVVTHYQTFINNLAQDDNQKLTGFYLNLRTISVFFSFVMLLPGTIFSAAGYGEKLDSFKGSLMYSLLCVILTYM